ncbi:hypothetical protein LIQ05_05370 [Blautia glucerasea]|uniref:hypothetical protein n=1 Tax=Blautia glucerasea TaxID=536633 RepID=UPI001D00B3CC|nr:hypothetical protein [Blautia glucerasea]MCB5386441.1 hypothetical protein [Blautia glucerasea]MCB5420796.1 hypothetical protein [Blautia luti]
MLGYIYLILATLLGREITRPLLPEQRIKEKEVTPCWITFSAAFGCGVLFLTWAVYIAAWLFSACGGMEKPLFAANLLVLAAVGLLLTGIYYRRKCSFKKIKENISRNFPPRKEIFFFLILFAAVMWIMFYVFHISGGYLYSGFTVFGDYAPHTAMIRSFSLGNNFPTQYPHFGGADVKYHFMFQFLTGNLEYLGMPIDVGYNLVSSLSLWGFFAMLYSLAKWFSKSMAAGVLAVVFMVFRSGTAFFRFAFEHFLTGDLWETLSQNTTFIGYTPNEDWGLWNFNVYLNQRHLGFGLLIVALSLWIFMEWLEEGCAQEEKGFLWLRKRFFTSEAWKCKRPEIALLVGMLLGLCSFWNGAAVIAGLLILAGFAVFSDGKLDYLIVAVVTILFSEIQSKMFVSGSVVTPSIYLGFLAEEKTLSGVAWYLFEISGLVFLGVLVLVFFMKRMERAAAVSMLFPAIFAFLISLTPDINVNHKYIMISYAFLTIFWADAVCRLFRTRYLTGKLMGILLAMSLTVTGIYDFVVVLKDNDSGHRVAVNLESSLTAWLSGNLGKNDLILTPEYSMNEVTMSGVMLYLGWPYYAWSAGYDTYYRAEQAVVMYTTASSQVLKETVEKEHITYILYEDGMKFEEKECREDVIADTYPLVYESDDGRIRIYGTEQ